MRVLRLIIPIVLIAGLGPQIARADWSRIRTNSFAWYKDISFVNKTRGWIVGTDGAILSTDDGGESWQPNQRFTTDTIIQIQFTDESNGWMLCERNVYARGKDPISYLRKTTNGGVKWEKVEFEDIGRERVTRLLFTSDGRGTAFGEGGYFYKLQVDGTTWKRFSLAVHFLLLDGAYTGDSLGAIVGAGGTVMFTEDGGLTWERATLIGDTEAKLNAISFGSKKSGWAVGNRGKIFRSNGGARLWREQSQITAVNLNDVFFTDARRGWVVGDDGTILRTRDGGNSWSEMNSRVTHRLEKVIFHGDRGFAIGYGGTVLKYDEKVITTDPGQKPTLQKRN